MSAYTPGPWAVGTNARGKCCVHDGGSVVCDVTTRWTTDRPTEWQANAFLIAAAPELLDALKRTSKALEIAVRASLSRAIYDSDEEYERAIAVNLNDAHAAITRAEGIGVC